METYKDKKHTLTELFIENKKIWSTQSIIDISASLLDERFYKKNTKRKKALLTEK